MEQKPKKNHLRAACRAFEHNFILIALKKAGWSRTEAARILGIPLSTLKYRIKALGMSDSRPKMRKIAGTQDFLENGGSLREACRAFEHHFIMKALQRAQWDRRKASQALGMPLSTLKYRLSKRSRGG